MRARRRDRGHRLRGRAGLADDVQVGLALQHRPQALPHDRVVVDEHDPRRHRPGRGPVGDPAVAPALIGPVAVTAVVLIVLPPSSRRRPAPRSSRTASGCPPAPAARPAARGGRSASRPAPGPAPPCSPARGARPTGVRRSPPAGCGAPPRAGPTPSSEIVSRTRAAAVRQPHDGPARVGVHGRVEQRLARDPEERLLAVRGQRHRLAADPHLDRSSSGMCTPESLPEHRRQVLVRLAVPSVQGVDRRPELLDGAAREVLGRVELGAQPGDRRSPCAPARCASRRTARTG